MKTLAGVSSHARRHKAEITYHLLASLSQGRELSQNGESTDKKENIQQIQTARMRSACKEGRCFLVDLKWPPLLPLTAQAQGRTSGGRRDREALIPLQLQGGKPRALIRSGSFQHVGRVCVVSPSFLPNDPYRGSRLESQQDEWWVSASLVLSLMTALWTVGL